MWWQVLAAAIGIRLMAAPAILNLARACRTSTTCSGPSPPRSRRWPRGTCCEPCGSSTCRSASGVAAAPLVLGAELPAILAGLVSGAALIGLSLLARASRDRYAGGWRSLTR